MSVRSRQGEGSVFTFELPLTLSANQNLVSVEHFDSGCVLIVDNNPASLKILSAQLKAWGLSSSVARNAADGVSGLLRAQKKGNAFEVVIIDERCESHADSFIEALKAEPAIADTPVILLSDVTGYEFASDSRYAAQVSKPVVGRKLFEALDLIVRRTIAQPKGLTAAKPRRARPVMASPVPARRTKRVLLAEANPAAFEKTKAFISGLANKCS